MVLRLVGYSLGVYMIFIVDSAFFRLLSEAPYRLVGFLYVSDGCCKYRFYGFPKEMTE